jgi:gliding motility-associated-like protein/uncharacterized repeat protein (TIGR01451 family)
LIKHPIVKRIQPTASYINNYHRKGLTLIYVAELWTLGSFTMWGQVCTITPTYNDVVCNGEYTGSINISVTGGSEPYIFSWTGPGSFVSTSRNLTGLCAGSYTLTVIGNAGSCTGIETVTINQPVQPMTIITQPATQTDCYGNTVEFSIDITGDEGAVSYQWQSKPPGGNFTDIPGANSSTVTIHDIGVNGQNIDGTEYRVIITDDCGSITSVPALLNINSISSLSGSVNLTICNGGNTAYEIQTHGSVAGYQWSFNNGTGWDPVADEGAFSGVTSSRLAISGATVSESGSYRVSVTFNTLNQPDGYPVCVITSHTRTRNLTVLPPISLPLVSAAQTVCFDGVPDPLIASPSSGGSGSDYSYQWQNSNDGVSWTDISGAQALLFSPQSLTTTTWYRLAATDEGALACGTANSLPVVITVDPMPVAVISVSGPTTFCEEGSVTLTSSLASSYFWSTGDTSREITVSSSGSYSVSIADDCGNTSTCTSVITVPPELSAIVTSTIDASCHGVNNGSIDITVSGGTEPYSFLWSNDAIIEDLTALPAGSYSVTVTDFNGCLATLSEIVLDQPERIITVFDSVGPYCFGAVIPDLPTSSTNAITGIWTPVINNTATTTYTFTPAAGECATITTLEITVSAIITLAIGTTATTCPSDATGAINLIVSGGNAPFTFSWSNGASIQNLTDVVADTYTVTVTDANGCTATGSAIVAEPPAINASTNVTNASSVGASDGSVNLTVTGGTTPYTFSWSNGAVSEDISGLSAGTYIVTITDANGCSTTATAIVSENASPALSISKTVGQTNISTPTTLNYTITIRNTGSVGLTAVTVTDPFAGGATYSSGDTDSDNVLDPNETWIYTADYAATQADIDAGDDLVNIASVVSAEITTPLTAQAVTTITTTASLNVTKTVDRASISAPATLNYTITLRNNGSAPLTGVNVSDPFAGGAGYASGDADNDNILDPGESWIYTADYAATQADIDAGDDLVNIASVTSAEITTPLTAQAVTTIASTASLSVTKTVDLASISAPATLHYTITVRNTGTVSMTGINVSDPLTGVANYSSGDTDGDNILDPGETWIYTASFNVTQAMIDAGNNIVNIVRVTTSQVTTPVTAQATTTIANQQPRIDITKTASPTSYSGIGQTLNYTIIVTNTGNVTLTNVVIDDPLTGLNQTIPGLPPGASRPFDTTYQIVQNDVNRGFVTNNATATGTYAGVQHSDQASVTVRAQQRPEIRIVKSASETSFTSAGEIIHYSLTLTNTGNVTLTGVVANDPGAMVTCAGAPYTLSPGATTTCTAIHTVTAADIAARNIRNIATASGSDPSGIVVTDASNEVTVSPTNLAPSITCPPSIESGTDATVCGATINAGLGATYSDPNGNVASLTWIMTGATPANSPATGINNINSFTFNSGITTVTYTVTDEFGLSETCSFTVAVTDTTIPDAVCTAIDVYLDANTGEASIVVDDIDDGSTDNCGIASMLINVTEFDCTNIGPNNVTLTVTDNSGNVGTCISVVTVHYAQPPDPEVTPAADVVCNGETINLALTSNIPGTAWTWTAISSPEITGANGDNSGLHSTITQTLNNSDRSAHNVLYTITPRVYGQCDLTPVSAEIWVNPIPQIQITPVESVICYGETATLTVGNPNGPVRGMWQYDLTVMPDPDISGNTASGTFTSPTNLNETLTNEGTENQKVVYTFTPRIVPVDGGTVCTGPVQVITIWVHPRVHYTENISDFNGFNISCYGKANGFIDIEPSPDLAPYIFAWTGPNGFTASTEDISHLFAGEYLLAITDVNNCTTTGTFVLDEPDQLNVALEPSVSMDGAYNINCAGASTGSVRVTVSNNVGAVNYLWMDGGLGSTRTNLSAGDYKVIITDSNNCQAESSITLTEPEPIVLAFDIIDTFCPDTPDGTVSLDATGGVPGPGYTYLWSNNSTDKDIAGVKPGVYDVTVTDANLCAVTGSASVGSRREICLIIPDAFSPNNDLVNDTWIIGNIELYPEAEISIFNRWGQLVWNSQRGYQHPWDGRNEGGLNLPIDGYHYVIDLHNGFQMIVGDITIVR